ncbi:MFS transporter permease [Microbacterium sp. NEAU-LLC]|uniref:MFS transporter permease n=1 Tax=Microbacterium helvum TaxID=2773713 RepID=A0ABR8NM88_9MICO|nr:MFS transporter permease [Microbacterium helvum]MBD3941543.1 MFS transporter permease [Microbacterium helvum]
MWLRRAFFGWLIPAAFLLPLWLLVGWAVFNAGGWAFLWVLFLAIPGVFVWQLLLTLLVRARGTVRAQRAVSWWDVLGFSVWHGLVISLGFFVESWWAPVMVIAIVAGVGLFWLALWQLWSEARPSRVVLHTTEGVAYIPPPQGSADGPASAEREVIVITEKQTPPAG